MFLDWLERRIDPFAPFEEARRPPGTVAGFAWFYLRPVRGPLAILFVVARSPPAASRPRSTC